MPSQREINLFSLAFHRQAVERLRADGDLVERARGTIRRWREQRGPTASDAYFDRWDGLLAQGPEAVERATCADTEEAATLRSVSPLGFVLSPRERSALRLQARG